MPTSQKTVVTKNKQSSKKPKRQFRFSEARLVRRLISLRARRAHKSFVLTRRRDIPKRANLPGYIQLSWYVGQKVWEFRRVFLILLGLYMLASLLLIGYAQQDNYRSLTGAIGDIVKEVGTDGLDAMTQVAGLFGASLLGSLNSSLTDMQQFYLVGLYILMWLAVVWLLRQMLAGNSVKVRDGLYNSGAPLISSICIVAIMMFQALPGAIGVLLFTSVTQDNFVSGGVVAMCFGIAALLLTVLSLYWLSSSFIALIIVTLPGTYPMVAMRSASGVALGRRLQLLLRLLWLVVLLLLIWIVLLVPALLIDLWVKVEWLPLVTLVIQLATGASFIYGISYIFILYQKMISSSDE